MRQKIAALFLALVAILGLQVATSSAASAQPAGCPAGTACMWYDPNFQGPMLVLPWSTYYKSGACTNLSSVYPYSFGYNVTSVYNDYGSGYRLIMNNASCGYVGNLYYLYAKTGVNLNGSVWDNNVKSFRIAPL